MTSFRWHVPPELHERLLGPDGLPLERWLRERTAQVVKRGPHRTVYRVELPGLDFYLKHYPLADLRSWLRQLVRPSKARGEFDKALEVSRRGVPTFEPLAYGERPSLFGPAESYLLTRTLERTEPLDVFLQSTWPELAADRQARLAPRLAVALARLLARMHDAGIRHNDLHAGNLLLRLDPGDRPALFLIDLHAVSLGRPLTWEVSRANLIMINRWFSLRVNRSDRLRFWLAYCGARQHCPELEEAVEVRDRVLVLARDLEKDTQRSNVDFWRRRDRRCVGRNRAFGRLHAPGVTGHVVNDLDPEVIRALVRDPDEPFRRPGVRFLKNSRTSTVVELEMNVNGVSLPVIYKRFNVTGPHDPWAALLRPTAAARSWTAGHGFRERSLPTARPLLLLHRRQRGLCQEGYLLTEKIDAARELQDYVADLTALPDAPCRRRLRDLLERVARVVRHLHRCRLSHRDLKAANILVRHPSGTGAESPTVWLIDLVGVTRNRGLRRARRYQNLARLHASFRQCAALTRTDKLRFLRAYLQWGVHGREGWKEWWHAIAQATERKVAHNLKTGRPLR